jgi:SAM-dependent methyltransferase
MSKFNTLIQIFKVIARDPKALKKVLVVEKQPEKLTHDKIYDSGYFQFVEQTTARSAGAIANSIICSFHPASVVDVGCGTGTLIKLLQEQGVQVKGLEYAEAALKECWVRQLDVIKFDVANDLVPPRYRNADVAVSMEVGQQLPDSYADQYVNVLCQVAEVVVFSSATPGQGDRRPLNEQPHQYWIEKFLQGGYSFDEALSQQWRNEWKMQDTAPWFYSNVMIFRKTINGQ